MTAKPITESEWMAELEHIRKTSAKGLSAQELADKWDVHVAVARQRLRRLQQLGRLVVGFRVTTTLDGRNAKTPVYQIKRG